MQVLGGVPLLNLYVIRGESTVSTGKEKWRKSMKYRFSLQQP